MKMNLPAARPNRWQVSRPDPIEIGLADLRQHLYAAVVCDALDTLGYCEQSPRISWLRSQDQVNNRQSSGHILVGRCRTTLWADMAHEDPHPYALELQAVDSCRPDDVFIAAASGSIRSGIWGELLTTAAMKNGCVGAIIDGCIRDVSKIRALGFPVYSRGQCLYDSLNRQRVIDCDVPVEIGQVRFTPNDLVFADEDGVVVVPETVEAEVIARAWEKVHAENEVRDAIRAGMSATAAWEKYGVL